MDSVAKPTILNLIDGNWLPFQCALCGNNGPEVKFAWWTDPILCWECTEKAPQDVRQRLQRVKAARQDLGFENFSRYDLEEALWPGRSRFFPTFRVMPPVFGFPFTNPALRSGQIAESYCLRGLSSCPPSELAAQAEGAPLEYAVFPAQPDIVNEYRAWMRFWTSRMPGGAAESDHGTDPPLRSEVIVCIGGAIIPEAQLEDHYMWSWRPEAPWLGYKEGPHQTGSLPKVDRDLLFKAGRELLKIHFRQRPRGSGRFESDNDFEAATFAAVAALLKQNRRITQDAVGAHLISKRGRNRTEREMAGESHGDPGRQLREWCTAFKRNPEDLIRRALDACANEEEED